MHRTIVKISTPPTYIGELNDIRLGDLRIAASDLGLVAVEWADSQVQFDSYLQKLKRPIQPNIKKIAPYARELREYLSGKRMAFTIPIDWSLFRPFQREALHAVYRIPYGETCTYHDIAIEIGRPNAVRLLARLIAISSARSATPIARMQ